MDTLNYMAVPLPDTISVVATPKEVIFLSCQSPTSSEDILLALTVGIIVLVGIAIIGHYICQSIATTQQNKLNEQKSRQTHELAKLEKEAAIKASANEFNAKQTEKQRDWLSEADKIKNDIERLNVRLKEAEVNAKISELGMSKTSTLGESHS